MEKKNFAFFGAGREPYLRAPENQPFLGSPLPQTKPQFMVAFKLATTIYRQEQLNLVKKSIVADTKVTSCSFTLL
jgi:hypothetical protein